jgi:hypothetical protein
MNKRQEIANSLEEFVRSIPSATQSPVDLEKLKAGLSLIVEDQKAKIADASENDRTWFEIVKGTSPIIITGVLGILGTVLTLIYQGKQHTADSRTQREEAKAADNRESLQLQATEVAKAREDRTALLERLAQAVSSGPAPSPSCWYAEGIWADYSKDEPLPQVLTSRCPDAGAESQERAIASAGAQWVVVVESDSSGEIACKAADRARSDGLENVQVLTEAPRGTFSVTAGAFSSRLDAIGYLQRVRAVRANALIARQYKPKWEWFDCTKGGGK